MTLATGTHLGPYELLAPLGAGGMGEVFRARDARLGRDVAVKMLPDEALRDAERLRRFEREARAVAALNHPNVLTLYDVGTHEGAPYVVTELLEGETLRTVVSRRTPVAQQILGYALQAARGLEAAHAKGIIHRDLKPENLFLTTDGRVKILDFGLAKLVRPREDLGSDVSTAARSTEPGTVAGTLLYMSPEQARAQPIDARSDVFSLGIVLHELLSGKHPFRKDTLAATLTAIVEAAPPALESMGRGIPPAVGGIVRRCLEKSREGRYASGHEIVIALEAVLATPSGAAALREVEERSPYPGLSAFTEKDAAVFHGREKEVEELWSRIPNRKLLAVIGPSGAGKTSFVRAGLVARRPEGWKALVATPGAQPFRGLGRVLGPELAGDTEALGRLVDVEDPDVAVQLLGRWRRGAAEALLVVDQLEELFTLNPPEVQERFAALLGRLSAEADVHVLLSLRDDFLMRCHDHAPLTSVFTELTPLGTLSPQALERAVREPAKKRGYRFDEEALVDEMVQAIEGARAALPLLAFAVSRLWEKRNREEKVLTRAAYEEIGGVAGALAQHAEATMDRIGPERQGTVREIFRNLVTAQGTRAVMDQDDLLSAFPDREGAEAILGRLIDARLLTAYEVQEAASHPESGVSPPAHRIEIAHESLLKAWPRLVRWQAQDEEGSVLRDQLKQAARVWEEKGRSTDVLWSGTAYREFEVWRERYPGRLTETEESFAHAMTEQTGRRRRRGRLAVASVIVLLLGVLAVVTGSRQQAVDEARRAKASKLLALGGQELERHPTAAAAYAIASLELEDTLEARMFALDALWRGPTALIHTMKDVAWPLEPYFSPDGRWLTAGGASVPLFARDGGRPRLLEGAASGGFGPDSDLLVLFSGPPSRRVGVWSISAGEEVRTLQSGGPPFFSLPRGARVFTFTHVDEARFLARAWPLGGGEPEPLGHIEKVGQSERKFWDIDVGGQWLAFAEAPAVYVQPLSSLETATARCLGRHDGVVKDLRLHPAGDRVGSVDESDEIRIWPTTPGARPALRILNRQQQHARGVGPISFDPSGRRLLAVGEGGALWLWDLEGPPDAEPLALRSPAQSDRPAFSPDGDWLATTRQVPMGLSLWPLGREYARVLRGHLAIAMDLAFAPDGSQLFSVGMDQTLRSWPLEAASGERGRVFFRPPAGLLYQLSLDPQGRSLVVGGSDGKVFRLPLKGGPPQPLQGFSPGSHIFGLAFSPDGRFLAAAPNGDTEAVVIRVWDLESGEVRVLDPEGPKERENVYIGGIMSLAFTPDGRLVSAGRDRLLLWDLEDGTKEVLRDEGSGWRNLAVSPDGRHLLRTDAEGFGFDGTLNVSSELLLYDLQERTSRAFTSHGDGALSVAFDPTGEIVVTGGVDGVVRVGTMADGRTHLLLGHEGPIPEVEVSPDGQWIASAGFDYTVRLWPMPDVTKPPLHTLPRAELLTKLGALTNLRAVQNEESPTGYRLEEGPFSGWATVPAW